MIARKVRSVIYSTDRVPNRARRFGQADEYLAGWFDRGGKLTPFLLTPDQMRDGIDRAKGNPEDCPPLQREPRVGWVGIAASGFLFAAGVLLGVTAGGWL